MITQYIYDILLENDYVSIPDLGGFVCEYQSATIDKVKQELLPPSRKIAFNKALNQNDGLLVQYIVLEEGLTYKEADEKVRSFSKNCNQQLQQFGSLQLPKIGRLYVDEQSQMRFMASHEVLPLDSSFGLPKLSYVPVVKHALQEEVVQQEATIVAIDKQRAESKAKGWLYWAAASVAGVFLASTVWLNLGQPELKDLVTANFYHVNKVVLSTQQTILPSSGNEQIVSHDIAHYYQAKTFANAQAEQTSEVIEEISAEDVVSNESYPIVVGAFRGPITAGKYKDRLMSKGYETELMQPNDPTKLIKIVIHYTAETEEEALATIRKEVEENAWVLN